MKFSLLNKEINRKNFDCGIDEFNIIFKNYSFRQQQKQQKNFNKTYVLVDKGYALGFYTISNGSIELESLPSKLKKKLPKYPVPVAIIGRLAVSKEHQGKNYEQFLLVNALKKILNISQKIGIFAVVVHAKGQKSKNFYMKFGFMELDIKGYSSSLFITMKDVKMSSAV